MNDFKIFIVEDDNWYSELLHYHLSMNPEYIVEKFDSGQKLLDMLHQKPTVITLDYSLPDFEGEELLKRIKRDSPSSEVVVISGQEDIKTALGLLKLGAYDYIVKDDDTKERLWNTILKIKENGSLKQQIEVLTAEVGQKYNFSKTIIGSSEGIKKVFKLLEKAIRTNITVSITGETGTGKEVVAKAIHYNSDRKKLPFVAINVSAIPKDLIESELFGYEKGAFTGAINRRAGKFEEAGNGTIFLDEIGEMDESMQAKLLRVLQERELTRIGGNNKVKINCRVIVATHKTLIEEVKNGNFRQDLYYRLLGLPIELPALRERKEDILLLAKHFIKLFAKENGFEQKRISDEANKKLIRYGYPGNIRELKAIIDLAMVMSEDNIIDSEHINFPDIDPLQGLLKKQKTLRTYNFEILNHYLKKYDHNVLKVARALDIGKSTIYRMIKEQEEEGVSQNA